MRDLRARTGLLVGVLLLVGACGGDDGAATTTSTTVVGAAGGAPRADTDTTVPPDTVTPDTVTPDTATPDTESDTTTTPPAGAADCVIGTWLLRSQDFLDQISASAGAGVSFDHVEGDYVLQLDADGTGINIRDGWVFRTSTPEGTLYVTFRSTELGTFSVDGDVLTYEDSSREGEVTMELEIGGVRQPLPAGLGTIAADPEALSGSGVFTCADDELTVTTDEDGFVVTSRFDRR